MPKPSWSGAGAGAATGASLGSAFGPWGTAIGGLLGGVGGLFGANKKKKPKTKFQSLLSPEQQQLLGPLYGGIGGLNQQAGGALSQLLNYQPEGLAEMQGPALEQFQTQIVPSILERFSGAGAGSSSALNQTLGQAAKGLTTDLAAMRSNLLQNASQVRMNALQSLLGYNQFLSNPNMNQAMMQPGKPGFFDKLAPLAGQIAGMQLSNFGGF